MATHSQVDLLPSAARTVDALVEFVLGEEPGILLVVDVTAFTAGTLTPRLQTQAGSGGWVTIWSAAVALAATGTTTYLLYPGASGGNYTEADAVALPGKLRLFIDVTTADSITYSVRMYRIP